MNFIQQTAFDKFLSSTENIALLGSAGTGKSFVFRKLVDWCVENNVVHAVTAMTGVAAELVCGKTLHSTLGLGILDESVDDVMRKMNSKAMDVWLSVQILFIDEASMLTGDLFDKLEKIGRRFQKSNLPFGGIRLVISADFLQLGPVVRNKEFIYLFEAQSFSDCFKRENLFQFKQLVRQQDDTEWGEILSRIRVGQPTNHDLLVLESTRNPVDFNDECLMLYCHNENVDVLNGVKLHDMILAGAKKIVYPFTLNTSPKISNPNEYKHLEKQPVTLCVGARVMHLVNDESKLIWNGSTGKIVDVTVDSVVVKFDSGKTVKVGFCEQVICIQSRNTKVKVTISFMPLKLCWATTIHKVQGVTLDKGCVNLSKAFANGQVYTALSRFKSSKGLKLRGLSENSIKTCERCLNFYKSLE